MAFASHIVTVRRLKKYIDDVIGKKANLPDTSKTIIGNISQMNSNKQNKTDSALVTTAKTIVGAINEINSNLSKAPIDVTNLFSISDTNVFWSAIYNPIAKTVKLSCYGHGSYPNGSIRFTVPSDYAFNLPNQYIIGALGSVRSSNDIYAFTLAKFNTFNNIQQVEVNYSQGITAEEVAFSVEYRVVD